MKEEEVSNAQKSIAGDKTASSLINPKYRPVKKPIIKVLCFLVLFLFRTSLEKVTNFSVNDKRRSLTHVTRKVRTNSFACGTLSRSNSKLRKFR